VSGKKQLPSLVTPGKTDWQIILEILEEAQLDLALAAEVSEELGRLSDVYLTTARATLLPSVNEVLATLKARGIRNGLLTGNSELRSSRKLEGREVLFKPPDAALPYDPVTLELGFQVLRPLCWLGLLQVVAKEDRGANKDLYATTPLWHAALRLETDAMLEPIECIDWQTSGPVCNIWKQAKY
jgi:hypothetical protein